MNKLIAKSHRVARAITAWGAIGLAVLCVVSWFMVFQGAIEIDLELNDNFPLNPYFVVALFMLFIALVVYLLSFIGACCSYLVMSLFKNK